MNDKRIILTGGAGLVGLNLIPRLLKKGYRNILVLDKHKDNILIARKLFPDIEIEEADISERGNWTKYLEAGSVIIMLQAQIGGNKFIDFEKNNVTSTHNIIEEIKHKTNIRLIHVSSSVVESIADDYYTNSKKTQEKLVIDSGLKCVILRPTLMFGWFDRKHLGWLSRFMQKIPVFPIPGNGKFIRQPLYAGDFCNVIISCISNQEINGIFNISGYEKIFYIDLIKKIKQIISANTYIVKIPFLVFYFLIWLWSLFDKNPPFTTQQLVALSNDEEFEIIDWAKIFSISCYTLDEALNETFNDKTFSKIKMKF